MVRCCRQPAARPLLWAYLFGPLAGAVLLAALIKIPGLRQPLTCSLCGIPPRDTAAEPVAHPVSAGAFGADSSGP